MLTLASASPRRRELLAKIVKDYQVASPGISEEFSSDLTVAENVLAMARSKAATVAAAVGGVVLGADTIVCRGEKVYGKPGDEKENIAMLEELSGDWHQVLTGVVVFREGNFVCGDVAVTNVKFRDLELREIESYVKLGRGLDKAGGYGIQDEAGAFVEALDGCYYNVMGLPLTLTARLLEQVK